MFGKTWGDLEDLVIRKKPSQSSSVVMSLGGQKSMEWPVIRKGNHKTPTITTPSDAIFGRDNKLLPGINDQNLSGA